MKWSWVTIREYLFYLLVFSLPWQTRWIIRDQQVGGQVWEYGRISLYGWDILLILLIVLSWPVVWQELKKFNFLLGVEDSELRSPSSTPNNPTPGTPFYLYLGLLVLSLLSLLWADDKLLALVWSLRLLEGGMLWLLVLALKPKLQNIFWSLAIAGSVQGLWGIWQFLTQSTFANKWLGVAIHPLTQGGTSVVLTSAGRWLRAYGGQVHPNVLGGLLVITCLATVWLYLNNKSEILVKISRNETNPKSETNSPASQDLAQRDKSQTNSKHQIFKYLNSYSYSLLLLFTVQLIGLFFTFSRGAWLALFLTLGIWWWNNKRSVIARSEATKQSHQIAMPHPSVEGSARNDMPGLGVIIVTALVFIILGGIYWQPTMGRILSGSKLEQQSLEDRAGSVKESSSLLQTVWWHGTGVGNYTVALQKFDPGLPGWRYQPVHNIFLLILTELGIIGLLLFLWMLWELFNFKQFFIQDSLFLISILITLLVDHYWWTVPSMFLLFWLIVALNKKLENF
ncbi:MAG: O-antigen ligase family protein [Patescibacteria group bacterium]